MCHRNKVNLVIHGHVHACMYGINKRSFHAPALLSSIENDFPLCALDLPLIFLYFILHVFFAPFCFPMAVADERSYPVFNDTIDQTAPTYIVIGDAANQESHAANYTFPVSTLAHEAKSNAPMNCSHFSSSPLIVRLIPMASFY